ncbi:sodium/proton antiporter [Salmonella enterica subsp. enterica serovar Typhi]|nr:sodium/proton antiporter [Salmonella enterica subsp. enterica serovar Typhi]CGP25035.1 sodium/proton antiporter [Salmonella enterica subsp. enterica serovar Typhi]CHJ36170.1 sodium/proton antiporter [Salmonella enterica subsp. enterica serovar Typhi]CIL18235.1 sodium/proton antiporter [Salmonella enterica subsp. enterica serovar Typhi]CIL53237.1 sodium/proton antiporter [Salmonella enterica subsp. enterica serovar Typhi]
MSASQNKKKTLSLGLALIPVISMLLLLIIGYGIMGLRIYFDCSLLFNQRGLRLYRYIVGVRRDGWRCVNGGCRRAGRVACSSSWRRCFWRLFRRQNLTVVRLD